MRGNSSSVILAFVGWGRMCPDSDDVVIPTSPASGFFSAGFGFSPARLRGRVIVVAAVICRNARRLKFVTDFQTLADSKQGFAGVVPKPERLARPSPPVPKVFGLNNR